MTVMICSQNNVIKKNQVLLRNMSDNDLQYIVLSTFLTVLNFSAHCGACTIYRQYGWQLKNVLMHFLWGAIVGNAF